jgi:ABC-type multidrug transport system fused ATPase/permease subunit
VLLAVICVAVPIMTALIALCAAFFVWLLVALDRASREIKRMSNNAMGPLLSNAAEAVRGREMILAMGCTEFFEARHRLASDEYARANFASGAIINWGTLASNLLTFFVSIAACALLVGMGDKALIGLTLAYGE